MLPFVKLFTPFSALSDSEPFKETKYEDMGIFEYAGHYISYGSACLLDYWSTFEYESPEEKIRFSNDGQCSMALPSIIFYTVALFVIQYNLNSVMHHKFTREA